MREVPGMESRESYLGKDGFRIHVKLDFPENCEEGKKLPLVIVVHGFTGHMEERHISAVAGACLKAGTAALRVEMYGHGKSDGSFQHHNIFEWISELLYVIDRAEEFPFADGIFLAGHSQGGLAIILAAALKRDRIRGIIPLSPALSIPDGCRRGTLFGQHFDPYHVPDRFWIDDVKWVDDNYIRTMQAIDTEKAIMAFEGPVLLVHGTEDETVPFSCSERAAELYKNAKLVPVEGDDHCYDRHPEVVTDAVTRFLREQQGF